MDFDEIDMQDSERQVELNQSIQNKSIKSSPQKFKDPKAEEL